MPKARFWNLTARGSCSQRPSRAAASAYADITSTSVRHNVAAMTRYCGAKCLRRIDERRHQCANEDDGLGIGQIDQQPLAEKGQALPRRQHQLRRGQRWRPPALDAQPHQIAGTDELQYHEGSLRSGQKGAKTDGDDGQVDQQRQLQPENRGKCRPIAMADAGTHAQHRPRPWRDGDQDRRQQKAEPDREAHLRRWICVTSRTAPLSADVAISA